MNRGSTHGRLHLALALVPLAITLWAGTPVRGQSMPSASPAVSGQSTPPQDDDIRIGQLAKMDQFLDSHPELAEQLRKDPALINNQQFVEKHPELQEFLQSHPGIREEFRENPAAFMRQEERFDRREDARFGDRDITRGELANMDRFLDSHPEIAEQLRKDPALINNQQFVDKHPELQAFLQSHPGVREEFREDPAVFMRAEERFDRREDARFGDRDITRGELANMDRFLDSHPEIAEQLRKDPALINNQQFVDKHPELQAFLQSHPGVREEFREDPAVFMRAEERFDRREDRRFGDGDITRGELANMDRFLDSHPVVAEQLTKNPSLINNQQFVDKHPELQEFLQSHPGVREEFKENPTAFMQAEQRFEQFDHDRSQPAFGRFLSGHSVLAQQLFKDPSLINNKEFMAGHPELQDFLQSHPEVSAQLTKNPQAFMNSMPPAGNTATIKPMPPQLTKPK
jgi:phage-related protein